MIDDGDKIIMGLSGGKDSMTLLSILDHRLKRIPVTYSLVPVYIDPGFENSYADRLAEYCNDLGYTLRVEITDDGPRAHDPGNQVNPCFLCSRHRRKRLFEIADELGCSTLALGHTKDDIIETLFINMFYSGHISTMMPCQSMFQGRFKVIRPLAFVDESHVLKFAAQQTFPPFFNVCPSSSRSKRREIKNLLNQVYSMNPNIKGNIFRSMSKVREDYLLT
ncbi:MAG: tRNA 2-thiocytidine(32) synthetase TtcA [Proteobacteria bacterium]|nr:tRNA 2-thiocytidine(32) synthetase TtcA [Pseudomonadota bacterium]